MLDQDDEKKSAERQRTEQLAASSNVRIVSINGVDISQYVKKVDSTPGYWQDEFDKTVDLLGTTRKVVTISGRWDVDALVCIVCKERFTPGPEGTPVLSGKHGDRIGVVCPPCAVAMIADA